jgi:hypothetical protein
MNADLEMSRVKPMVGVIVLWLITAHTTVALAGLAAADWWPKTMLAVRHACGVPPRGAQVMQWRACRQEFLNKAYAAYVAAGPPKQAFSQDELGIRSDETVPGVRGSFDVWEGYANGQLYRIFAGQMPEDVSNGVIYVDWAPRNTGQWLEVPSAGNLTITAAHDGILELQAASRKPLSFDVRSRKVTWR